MRLYLKDQFSKLCYYLPKVRSLPVISYNISELKEKKKVISLPCNKSLKEFSFNFLFDYCVFPNNILTYYSEWQNSKRTMQIDDTIVQQIYFPPFKIVSQKIIVGVRIKEIFKEEDFVGFSYETLKGHIEKGISYFQILKSKDKIHFIIKTYSKANNLFLDWLSPLFSSPYQDYCTNKAIKNMIKEFKKENKL